MNKKKSLPKGFICRCGERHEFHVYVYAHWDIVLTFDCPGCGQWEIFKGKVQNKYEKAKLFYKEEI